MAAAANRTYVFDANQKPVSNIKVDAEKFALSFLKSSADYYPVSNDNLAQLKSERSNQVKIGNVYKVEEFLHDLPCRDSKGNTITTYHDGYFKYLLTAWHNDCGIEVGPWHIWNIVLHQLCQVVKADPERYRPVFTTPGKGSSDKIHITFSDGQMFDIHRFIGELKKHVPLNVDTFVPRFPHEPPLYAESMYGLFADMVQNYYSCGIFSCSLPKLRLLGSDEDWMSLMDATRKINGFFFDKGVTSAYLTKATKVIFEMITNLGNAEYWSKFFYLERCGSGSQEEVRGHVVKLLEKDHTILTTSLPSMISRYPFEYHVPHEGPQGSKMNYVSGIFYSTLDDEGYLVPEYHCNITVANDNLCKVTNQEAKDIEVLIAFLKRMKKYSSDYDSTYQERHYTITEIPSEFLTRDHPGLRHLDVEASLEEYINRRVGYYGRKYKVTQEELDGYTKDYRKKVVSYAAHNNRVAKSRFVEDYLRLLNEERREKLKKKYYFWWQDETDLKNGDWNKRDEPSITMERWTRLLPKQEDDVLFITNHFDVIYRYIANNHFTVFTHYLTRMYNPVIYNLFLQRYRQEPFKYGHFPSGYSCYDARLKETNDPTQMYYNLVFEVFVDSNALGWRYLDNDVATVIKKACMPDPVDPLFECFLYSLRHNVELEVNSCKGGYWKLEERIKDHVIVNEINRYNSFCKLLGRPRNYVQVINEELERLGETLRVDVSSFEKK